MAAQISIDRGRAHQFICWQGSSSGTRRWRWTASRGSLCAPARCPARARGEAAAVGAEASRACGSGLSFVPPPTHTHTDRTARAPRGRSRTRTRSGGGRPCRRRRTVLLAKCEPRSVVSRGLGLWRGGGCWGGRGSQWHALDEIHAGIFDGAPPPPPTRLAPSPALVSVAAAPRRAGRTGAGLLEAPRRAASCGAASCRGWRGDAALSLGAAWSRCYRDLMLGGVQGAARALPRGCVRVAVRPVVVYNLITQPPHERDDQAVLPTPQGRRPLMVMTESWQVCGCRFESYLAQFHCAVATPLWCGTQHLG